LVKLKQEHLFMVRFTSAGGAKKLSISLIRSSIYIDKKGVFITFDSMFSIWLTHHRLICTAITSTFDSRAINLFLNVRKVLFNRFQLSIKIACNNSSFSQDHTAI